MIDTNDTLIEYTPEMITRREAVARVAALLGGVALIGGSALITGCRTEGRNLHAVHQKQRRDRVSRRARRHDLPTTSTPARRRQDGEFMARMVTEATARRQKIFRAGMVKLDDARRTRTAARLSCSHARAAAGTSQSPRQGAFRTTRRRALEGLKKAKEVSRHSSKTRQDGIAAGGCRGEIRLLAISDDEGLSLLGYFTSEIGATQARVYEDPRPASGSRAFLTSRVRKRMPVTPEDRAKDA